MGESSLMATNNFKPFATGTGANVTSQADYEALSALIAGFQAGKASSAQINKALRQSSSMSAMLGQFIGAAGLDALDNGNIATLLSSFTAALTTNLSLGTASKRNVGTGANQIPDMSLFTSLQSSTGYQKLPSGLIIQWDSNIAAVQGSTGATGNLYNFPIPFPNICAQILTSYDNGSVTIVAGAASASSPSQYRLRCSATSGSYNFRILAVGY